MIIPFGMYITPNRLIGLAAVLLCADNAGTMPSKSGKASIAPMPRKTSRRERAFLVMIIIRLLDDGHTEWGAPDDAHYQRRPPVIARRALSRDSADRRQIVIF